MAPIFRSAGATWCARKRPSGAGVEASSTEPTRRALHRRLFWWVSNLPATKELETGWRHRSLSVRLLRAASLDLRRTLAAAAAARRRRSPPRPDAAAARCRRRRRRSPLAARRSPANFFASPLPLPLPLPHNIWWSCSFQGKVMEGGGAARREAGPRAAVVAACIRRRSPRTALAQAASAASQQQQHGSLAACQLLSASRGRAAAPPMGCRPQPRGRRGACVRRAHGRHAHGPRQPPRGRPPRHWQQRKVLAFGTRKSAAGCPSARAAAAGCARGAAARRRRRGSRRRGRRCRGWRA